MGRKKLGHIITIIPAWTKSSVEIINNSWQKKLRIIWLIKVKVIITVLLNDRELSSIFYKHVIFKLILFELSYQFVKSYL